MRKGKINNFLLIDIYTANSSKFQVVLLSH